MVRRLLGARAIGSVVLRMRGDAFNALMRHDLSFYDQYPTGSIVSRVAADTQAFLRGGDPLHGSVQPGHHGAADLRLPVHRRSRC